MDVRAQRRRSLLRVSADFPDMDRRLIGAEVWLVERLPNGKEQSQRQSLRGLPHRHRSRSISTAWPTALRRVDIFGKLVADPGQGGMEDDRRDRQSGADPGQEGYQSRPLVPIHAARETDEIVDVALCRPDEKTGGLANRVFSIRIQAKQIR